MNYKWKQYKKNMDRMFLNRNATAETATYVEINEIKRCINN